jgi:hypothetical protein
VIEVLEEGCAELFEVGKNGLMDVTVRRIRGGWRCEKRIGVAQVQRDLAIAGAQGLSSHPHDISACQSSIKVRSRFVETRGKHF